MTVISLSGTSTTTSSRNEPNHTGMLFACVTANNASPQTLPVVPPQNITFSGVEITTAAILLHRLSAMTWEKTS